MDGILGVTGIQGITAKKTIHDILRSGKMHGIVRCGDTNFAIICDQEIDPEIFGACATAFRDRVMEIVEEQRGK